MNPDHQGLCDAITRAIDGDISLAWNDCLPAATLQIFTAEQEQIDPNRIGPTKTRLTKRTIDNWSSTASSTRTPPLEIVVIPVTVKSDWGKPDALLSNAGPADLLKNVFHDFQIPPAVLACFYTDKILFTPFPRPSKDDSVHMLSFRRWTIAWHTDHRSKRVRAIILLRHATWVQVEIADQIDKFLEDVTKTMVDSDAVGLLGVLLCTRHVATSLADLEKEAFVTERRLRKLIDGNDLQGTNELGSLLANHNWFAARAMRERSRLAVNLSYLSHLLDDDNSHASFQANPPSLSQSVGDSLRRNNFKALQTLTKSLVAQATKVSEEANMQLSTINNLIAQRDSAINLQLAMASSETARQSTAIAQVTAKDSSAMKMIAIVTMVYLPGTFVATCFSMGIFEWSASASDVVNPRIWVYILFTTVLTVLTIGGFAFWVRRLDSPSRQPMHQTKKQV